MKTIIKLALILAFPSVAPLVGQSTVQYTGGKWVEILPNVKFANAPSAINASGQILLTQYPTPNSYIALLYSAGATSSIPALSGPSLPGADQWGLGMNSSGHVVGIGSNARGFFYNGTTVTDLGNLGGKHTEPWAISDSDVVVGCSSTGSYTSPPPDTQPIRHAFKWSGGTITDLGTLGGNYACATAINSSTGLIAGVSSTASSADMHLFSYSGGIMTDLGAPNGNVYLVRGISDAGVIVGCSGSRGFYWNGSFNLVPLLSGDTANCATGINTSTGDIIGWGWPSMHPFLYSGGILTDLGLSGVLYSQPGQPLTAGVIPWAINASGVIVGFSQ